MILTACSRTDWAEEEDENDLALPQQTVTKNKDGTETIVSYRINEDGKKVKTTRRIKKTVIKQVVNPRVAERKQWAKFGQEKGKAAGPQTDTVSVAENILFRPQANWKASTEDKGDDEKKKLELKNAKIKCRICSGDHFTTKCPFKDTMAPEGADAPADMPDDAPGGVGGLGAGSGGYVPPHLRGKMGGGEKMGGKFDRDDSATLRVTNVSEFAEEGDLREMFSRYGHVTRVFLAKDRETGRAKGFAFISYADRSDAAKACEKMDGCKFFFFISLNTHTQTHADTSLQSVSAISFCASSSPRRLRSITWRRRRSSRESGKKPVEATTADHSHFSRMAGSGAAKRAFWDTYEKRLGHGSKKVREPDGRTGYCLGWPSLAVVMTRRDECNHYDFTLGFTHYFVW
jgi:translation initiation factor 3 subunit G